MRVKEFLYSKYGKIIISIILGLGFATLFRKSCSNEECYRFVSPDFKEVSQNTYKYDNNCYKFEPKPTKCNNQKKTVTFA